MNIPLTVPKLKRRQYEKNYLKSTHNTERLFIFSGDQKIEHLNKDFYGPKIHINDAHPKHLFEIASKAKIGAFATQLGLIARYGQEYPDINYIIKMNSKTNLIPSDVESSFLYSPKEAITFAKQSKLNIVGLGYTVYIGSEYEAIMLREASKLIYHAHQNGMIAILWMYPRGKNVKNELDSEIIAGAAGVGNCLGADFIKINPPAKLKPAILAAGNTKVLLSGGKTINEKTFLKKLSAQMKAGASGAAIGRNIHQKSLKDAISFCNKISKIINGK